MSTSSILKFGMEQKLKERGLIRKAGMNEQATIARSYNDFYKNFSVSGVYNERLTPSLIFQVMKKMVLKYSFLAINYDKDTNDFFPISKIFYNDVVEERVVEELNLEELFEELETFTFSYTNREPLFKLLLINHNTLVSVFDHAVFDGVSGSNFHQIFLEILNSLTTEELNTELTIDSNSVLFDLSKDLENLDSFPLASEDYLNYVPDLSYKVKKALKAYLPSSLQSLVNVHDYSEIPIVPGITLSKWPGATCKRDFKTSYRRINVPAEVIQKAIKLCRSKQVTLTPFLEVIICQTLCSLNIMKDESQPNEGYFLKSMLPSDLRRLMDPQLGHKLKLGLRVYPAIFNYIPIVELLQSDQNKDLFWKIVKTSHSNITQSSLDPKSVYDIWLSINDSYDENSLEKMAASNIETFNKGAGPTNRLSNLGFFKNDPNESTKFKLEDAYFSQSVGFNAGAIVSNVVSTEKGGLNIICGCMEEIFGGKEGLDKFAFTLRENIIKYAEETL